MHASNSTSASLHPRPPRMPRFYYYFQWIQDQSEDQITHVVSMCD